MKNVDPDYINVHVLLAMITMKVMNIKAGRLTTLVQLTQYMPILNKIPLSMLENYQGHILSTILDSLKDIGINAKEWLSKLVNAGNYNLITNLTNMNDWNQMLEMVKYEQLDYLTNKVEFKNDM